MSERSNESKRREILKFLGGIGLGAAIAETYERLYNIPLLERGFRKEIEYWLSQYNSAKQRLDDLSNQLKQKEGEINTLKEKVSNLENQYNVAKEETNRLNSTINKLDELELESTSAITYYREKMDEAIRNLKRTIEKYRAILGDDRVAFESSTVKILEDLKLTQQKLQKVLPYFPLILNFAWKPTRVINDKIYDINVSFEVASPLNSLREVEVMLIPVEYRYFITKYGMREEDYDKVFPKEEIKTIKLRPRGLEREMFDITFADLKGGREYLIKAVAKDVADSTNFEERKTSYIREFENIAPLDDITVIADYYTWYEKPSDPGNHWRYYKEEINGPSQHLQNPLLGEYASGDPIVIAKHIDWATGHGIDAFSVSWWTTGNDERIWDYHATRNFESFLNNILIKDIKFCILYENNGRFKTKNQEEHPYNWIQNLDDEFNRKRLLEDFTFLTKYFNHPSYLKIEGKYYIRFDFTLPFRGNFEGAFSDLRRGLRNSGYELLLANDLLGRTISPYSPIPWKTKDGVAFDESFFRRVVNTFDVVSGSNLPFNYQYVEEESKNIDNLYKEWFNYTLKLGKNIIPIAWPGHHYHPSLVDKYYIPLFRSPQRLEKNVEIALKYRKIVEIISFNGWESGTHIEPSIEEGYSYLESIRKIIKKT
jgi:polyhydroxyalkanoate synthesis regulator phasin